MSRAVLLALVAGAILAAAPAKSKTVPSKPSASTKWSAQSRTGLHSSRRRTKGRRIAHSAPAPSYQLHPDPERYTQIQQALADRGYFKGQPNGQWDDDSVDALKRFQADQKLESDGKINALTLTGLGLGPKHDGSTASSVPLSAASASSDPALNPPAEAAPDDLPGAAIPPPITSPQ